MQAVGIKELKAKLSEYVRAARSGETVLITDRSEVVAALGPVPERIGELPLSPLDTRFAEAARRGLVQLPTASRVGWRWKPRSVGLPVAEVEALLDDLRADREIP
jgi:prevent-host-death family protein